METVTERPPVVRYLPFDERDPNKEYRRALQRIKTEGYDYSPEFHTDPMRIYHTNVMRFNMSHGFPLITEREIGLELFHGAIGEIVAFIHGEVRPSEMEKYGMRKGWWKRWARKEHVTNLDGSQKFDLPPDAIGDHIGDASYGGVWGKFPTADGTTINQWERVIKMMIKSPTALTHRVVNWYPPTTIVPDGNRRVVVAPCHGDVQVTLNPATKSLVLDHIQRSADVPVGVPYNMIHYAAIGMMLAHVLGYTFTHYNHTMVNSHIYERQWDDVAELLSRTSEILPTVKLNFELSGNPVADFFAIRPHHFSVSDYKAHPAMKIDTPV